MSLKNRLKHTNGGHASDRYFSDEHRQMVADCRNCNETLLFSDGDKEAGEKLELTFIESTEERQYRRHYHGYFCSEECVVQFLQGKEVAEA